MANILIFEDTESIAKVLEIVSKRLGHNVKTYSNPFEAFDNDSFIRSADLIISDYDMGGATALDLLAYLKENNIQVKVVINSANPSVKEFIDSTGYNDLITGYVNKNSDIEDIQDYIKYFLEK